MLQVTKGLSGSAGMILRSLWLRCSVVLAVSSQPNAVLQRVASHEAPPVFASRSNWLTTYGSLGFIAAIGLIPILAGRCLPDGELDET
jgi:hypothetical protein